MRSAFTSVLLLVIFVVSALSVSALVDVTYHFNTFNPVSVEAYNCLDSDCNAVGAFSGSFPNGQTTTNGQLPVRFPSTLVTPHGYALFYVSKG